MPYLDFLRARCERTKLLLRPIFSNHNKGPQAVPRAPERRRGSLMALAVRDLRSGTSYTMSLLGDLLRAISSADHLQLIIGNGRIGGRVECPGNRTLEIRPTARAPRLVRSVSLVRLC